MTDYLSILHEINTLLPFSCFIYRLGLGLSALFPDMLYFYLFTDCLPFLDSKFHEVRYLSLLLIVTSPMPSIVPGT